MTDPRSQTALGPNTPAKLVGVAWRLWTANLADLAKIMAVFVLPFAVLQLLVILTMSEAIVDIDGSATAMFATQSDLNRATFYSLVISIAALLASFVAVGAGVWLLSQRAAVGHVSVPGATQTITWPDGLRAAWYKAGTLAAVAALFVLGVFGGLLLLIIPGIYLAVSWWVAEAAVMLDDRTATKALGRSFRLVSGHWWHTFGTVLLASLVGFLIGVVVGFGVGAVVRFLGGLGPEAQLILSTLLSSAVEIVVAPFTAAALLVLYYDLQGREVNPTDPLSSDPGIL